MMHIRKIIFFLLCLNWGVGFALTIEEGKQYSPAPKEVAESELVRDLNKKANGKIQVLEFFSYGCHWCYKLDPFIEKWHQNLPANVEFQRVPVEFQPAWATLSKAYYAAIDLDALDKVHGPLFEAINTNKLTNSSEPTLKTFFVEKGVKADDFTRTFNSFGVTRRHKWANKASQAYKITAVPIIFVQGPAGVYFSSVKLAGSEENLMEVVNFLIKKQEEASKTQNSTKPSQ